MAVFGDDQGTLVRGLAVLRQYHHILYLPVLFHAFFHIPEPGVFLIDVLEHHFGLAELAPSFVVQPEVIKPFEQGGVDRALAVFFEGLVEMAL